MEWDISDVVTGLPQASEMADRERGNIASLLLPPLLLLLGLVGRMVEVRVVGAATGVGPEDAPAHWSRATEAG